jgi:hypothetical protein
MKGTGRTCSLVSAPDFRCPDERRMGANAGGTSEHVKIAPAPTERVTTAAPESHRIAIPHGRETTPEK